MLKKLFALFRRKKEVSPPKPERRPAGASSAARSYSSGWPAPSSQLGSDNPMLNPLHPLSPASPIYTSRDDDCRSRSHEPASISYCSNSDSGSSYSSSSDCGSSSSSSCD